MSMSRAQRSAALTVGGVTFVTALFATTANVATPHVGSATRAVAHENLANFALEHADAALMRRHLPLAFIKEKLENGGESVSGPSQEQYENRAYPRSTIADSQRRGARSAYVRLAHNTGSRGGATTTSSTTRSFAASPSQSSASTAAWSYLGPTTNDVPSKVTDTGAPGIDSGRATAVVVIPGCDAGACTVYIGTAGGGVWRTDHGLSDSATWAFVSAGVPSGAIGSLFYDASHSTLYAGTGEPNGSGDSEAGVGLYRTSNGGNSWSLVGDSDVTARDRSVGSIAVAPDGTVYMGTDVARHGSSSANGGRRTPPDAAPLGLYRLSPGGSTFTRIFSRPPSPVDPGAGTGSDWFQGGVNHIELDPRYPSTVYAAVFGYGIWRSSARLDGTTAFRHVFATSHPKDTFGDRTEFALTVKNGHTRIYAGDENEDKGWSWLWRTDNADRPASNLTNANGNGGWTLLSNPGNGQEGFDSYNFCEGQCGYDMFVVTPPGHPNVVYIGGSMNYDEIFGTVPPRSNGRAVMRSVNAGRDFTDMTVDSNNVGIHPDQHGLAFVPGQTDQWFEVSDGGVIRVDGAGAVDQTAECAARHLNGYDLNDCMRWLKATPSHIAPLNQRLQTLQFQSVSTYTDGGATHYLGGTQDNGTWAFGPGVTGYESVGGDGGQSATDSGNQAVHFHTYFSSAGDVNAFPAGGGYGAGLNPDHWDYVSQEQDSSGEDASFYVPFINDPNNAGWIYEGLQHVWRTTDDGGDYAYLDANCSETDPARFNPTATCGDFAPIGQDLSSPSFGDRAGHYVVAISVAPSSSDVIWAGTRIGRLFVSTNGTAQPKAVKFTRIDSSDGGRTHITPGRFVSGIAVDPANPYHAFVSFSGYSAYAAGGHVYDVTYDPATGTATATDISGSGAGAIGDMPVTGIAYDAANDELYASTDFGVITAPSSGNTWSAAGTGFPISTVYGLTMAGSDLVAATHGRGAWVLPLP